MSTEGSRLTNVEYEHAVLGAAVRHAESREQILSQLTPDHFSDGDNRALFTLLRERHHEGIPIDAPTILHELHRDSTFHTEPAQYLAAVTKNPCTPSSLPWYTEHLAAYSNSRRLLLAGQELANTAQMTDGDPSAVSAALQAAENNIMELTATMSPTPWSSVGELAAEVGNNTRVAPSVTSGFYDLDDRLMGGFRPGQLVAIAARPGQGKSTFSIDIARSTSIHHGKPGMVISLEMDGTELASRILSAESQVSLRHITQWQLEESDRPRLARAQERIKDAPLYLVDEIKPALPEIRGAIIAAKRRLDIQYVVIDYVQLILTDGITDHGHPNRQEVVANVSRSLKALARALGIPVFIVSQMNRSAEQRADKTPMISDMRESGQIEQDCDIVLMLFRPDYYDPNDRPGEADVIIGKHRGGGTGVIPLAFRGHYSQFSSMGRDPEPAGGYYASAAA